jgi:hypothetical protein
MLKKFKRISCIEMGNDAKICILYNNASPLPILLLMGCEPIRASRWGNEVSLEVKMHTLGVLN